MKKRITAVFLILALACACVLPGCVTADPAAENAGGKAITVAVSSDTGSMDPAGSIALTYLAYSVSALDELLTFDEDGAVIAGVKSRLINYIFAVLVAATISVAIRIVGILVISSLIALPVATALQLEKGFKQTMLFAVLYSFLDITLGLYAAYWLDAAPGGVTAIISVVMLLAVIMYKEFRQAARP